MRKILLGSAALALLAVTSLSMASAAELKSIAILTPEAGTDYGWNQQGIDAAKAAGAAAGVKVIVADNLGYGDVRPTLREMAQDGAGLLIAHASGYNTSAPEIGEEMKVPVAIVDRPDAKKAGAVADYTASGHEGAYLAGRLAAKMSKTGTVGIVVSGEPPSWNSQSTAFAEGAKAEKPGINVRYAVIGPAAYSDAAGGKRVTEALIAAGADKVSINTAAVNRREFVREAAEKFGEQCIVVAIDAKKVSAPDEPDRWEIFTHGGRNRTGLDAVEYAREVVALGAGEVLLTSMDRDGTGEGFDLALTRAISDAVTVPVIASGGVGTLDHLVDGIRQGGASAVLAASIFHFGTFTIGAAKQRLAQAGLPVRVGGSDF